MYNCKANAFCNKSLFTTKYYHTCNFDDYICKYMCFIFMFYLNVVHLGRLIY